MSQFQRWNTLGDSRQDVLDDEGNRVLGAWTIPEDEPDEPVIVDETGA